MAPPTKVTPAFHYGGTLTPKGNLSSRPLKGKRFQDMARLERLCRIDIAIATAGIPVPDSDIALMLGRSEYLIRRMRKKVEYLRFRTAIQTGVALETEVSAAEMVEYHKTRFRDMLPDALRVIADELTKPAATIAERKLKVELARDVIDREGSFPKISRTDVHAKIDHNYDAIDSVSSELRAAMDAPLQDEELLQNVQVVLEANRAFSNSETLTHDKQEAALHQLEVMQPISDAVN